ncbi:MAG: exodeoxyribonuclease VII small subunit [Anaerolineales bacterium]
MAELKSPDEMRFEEAFEELAALVGKLEAGDLELEESLGLFERGQALAERCSQLLEEAEMTLRQLAPDEGDLESDSE